MRAVLQRVKSAKVDTIVDDKRLTTGQISSGWLVFLGICAEDTPEDQTYLVGKILNLRAFADDQGKMNRSILDTRGSILVVSQFTLYGDCRKGRRPSFTAAGDPKIAQVKYDKFCSSLKTSGLEIATGEFQSHMEVSLINDGPVTFILDSSKIL